MMFVNRFFPTFVLAAIIAAGSPAGAQTTTAPMPADTAAPTTGSHHGRHHHQSLMHALRNLSLTEAQKQQVAAFHSQEQQANQNADAATKHANAAKMRDQIMGILTPDQKTQLATEMHHSRRSSSGSTNPMPMASPGSN